MNLYHLFNQNKKFSLTLLAFAVFPLIGSSLLSGVAYHYESWFLSATNLEWIVITIAIILFMSIAFVPTSFVAAFYGFFMGFNAVFYVIPAYIIASFFGYYIGTKAEGRKFLLLLDRSGKSQKMISILAHKHWLLMIFARMSPLLPFAIMNIVLPIFSIRLRTFLIAGAVGMLPRTILMILLGTQVSELSMLFKSGQYPAWSHYATIVLIIGSIVGLGILFKQINRKIAEAN